MFAVYMHASLCKYLPISIVVFQFPNDWLEGADYGTFQAVWLYNNYLFKNFFWLEYVFHLFIKYFTIDTVTAI